MLPFYFGTPDKPLYGCYHEPQPGSGRSSGVILCPALWHEYIYSHRAYRQLATRLAQVGFPVLRFDYYGCGDSGGEAEQGDLPQHLRDISTAVCEMRKRSGVAKVCLVGLRVGGTLSMISGAERGDIEGLVLWDPVVDGGAYLREMRTVHRETLGQWPSEPRQGVKNGTSTDILGFPMTPPTFAEIERVDLMTVRGKPANSVLVIEGGETRGNGDLREHLERTGATVEWQQLPSPRVWVSDRQGALLVPIQILQAVLSWIARVLS
jgi:uncharacterized protein